MATKVYMEALSPTMEEGRLVTWLKNEGDAVAEGDVLAEVETDKATMELVARGSGTLRKQLIGDGDTAAVGSLIGVIAGEDEDVSELVGGAEQREQGPTSGAEPEDVPEPDEAEGAAAEDVAEAAGALAGSEHTESHAAERAAPEGAAKGEAPTPRPDEGGAPADGGDGRVKASPLARRLAAEAGMSLGDVRGSGPGGRIVKRDVEQAVEGGGPAARPPPPRGRRSRPRPPVRPPASALPRPAALADAQDHREAAHAVHRPRPALLPHRRGGHARGRAAARAASTSARGRRG
jgi:pyruvate dehydrogenase E2 component (dihydrolipoamide acetyltransferase)